MKKLLSFITSAAVLGITMMGRPVFAASSPPNWIHDTPAQLVAQFGDHHPLTLQLSGMIGVSAQVVQQLPNAKAVAGALANPSITAQQRAALESIPTEIKLVNSRGISGGAFCVVLEALRDKGLRTTEKEFSPNNPRRDAVLWAGIGRDLQN